MHYELVTGPHPWIERVWSVRGSGSGRETIFPDGSFEIVFNLGDPVLQHIDGGVFKQPSAMLVGEIRRAVTVEPSGSIDMVGVRLRIGAAEHLFGTSPACLRDQMLDLSRLGVIRERLGDETSLAGRAAFLGAALSAAIKPRPANGLAVAAIRIIANHHGWVSVSRLASNLGVSVTALRRAFHRAVGMSPKTLCRVLRMRRALELLRLGVPAAAAAVATGFFDQSHFVNEFRAFAHLSPSRYVEVPGGLASHFAT